MKLLLVHRPAALPALVPIACSMSRARRSPGPTIFSMPSIFANCRRARCALTPMTCCTSPAGFRASPSLCRKSPNPLCSTMSAINSSQQPQPTPQTVNHRLTVIRCLYRFHYGQRDSRRPFPFPAHLYDTLPARLWPPPSRCCLRAPPQATPARHPAALCRAGRQVLGSFRTFRDLAMVGLMLLDGLRSCEILALQLEDLKLADAQMRVLGKGRKQRLLPLPGEILEVLAKLSSPGTAADQLPFSVRFPERPPAWSAHDAGRTPLAVPPSSIAQPGPAGQSAPVPPHLRSGYGAGRHLLARAPAPDGTCADSHHHALCPTCAPGRLARICPRRRQPLRV